MATSVIPNVFKVHGGCCVDAYCPKNNLSFVLSLSTNNSQSIFLLASTRWDPNGTPQQQANYRAPAIYHLQSSNSHSAFELVAASSAGTPVVLTATRDANDPQKYTITSSSAHTDYLIIGTNAFSVPST